MLDQSIEGFPFQLSAERKETLLVIYSEQVLVCIGTIFKINISKDINDSGLNVFWEK